MEAISMDDPTRGMSCGSTNAGTAHRRGLGLYQHDAYAVKLAHLGDAGGQGTAKGTTSKFTGTKHRGWGVVLGLDGLWIN